MGEAILTSGEVHWLLTYWKLDMPDESPLALALEVPASGAEGMFRRKGFLEDNWRDALGLLCAPDFQVRVILPTPLHTVNQIYYARCDDTRTLVGCWPEGDEVRIAFPWSAGDLAAEALGALTAASLGGSDDLTADLSVPPISSSLSIPRPSSAR